MGRIEVITHTDHRLKYSPAAQAAIMREADALGCDRARGGEAARYS
ncbi:hypothetical protein [Novosphingobium pentaromativorans]|uniref:Uncharacterized protein n=1 Tax=Novosphingobium pentaromativorans US6-1 TaxID=1088721 RepID=G6EKE1_9SPHN|nr:hypothetical protein [Novosphingobium pentaromativorans]EHJ58243.1 hypothetical protein NSU_4811 [Novosphingobium pentaromativorans US6-1]